MGRCTSDGTKLGQRFGLGRQLFASTRKTLCASVAKRRVFDSSLEGFPNVVDSIALRVQSGLLGVYRSVIQRGG